MRKGFMTADAPMQCDECLDTIPRGSQYCIVDRVRVHPACSHTISPHARPPPMWPGCAERSPHEAPADLGDDHRAGPAKGEPVVATITASRHCHVHSETA
jgi:hypothetical protein